MVKSTNNTNWIVLIAVVAVVAILVSLATVSLTGNVISVKKGYDAKVYTKAEIDKKLSSFGGSCEYIHFKSFDGKTTKEACSSIGKIPKILDTSIFNTLYNKVDCSPSYQIYTSTSNALSKADGAELLGRNLLGTVCHNAKFPDGSSNGGFSSGIDVYNEGIICC